MRKIVRYLLAMFCIVSVALAQAPVFTYVTRISLAVQTGVYVDSLADATVKHILSGKIRVALAPRAIETETDQSFIHSDALRSEELASVVYRAYINNAPKANWTGLPRQSGAATRFPFDALLVDTTLQPDEQLTIEFRFSSSRQIIQRCVFVRDRITPVIGQYRSKDRNDRTDDSIHSKSLGRNGRLLRGFTKMTGNRLVTVAGKPLELLLQTHSLNKDSSVRYRLHGNDRLADTTWETSGHVLTLSDLPANDSLVLDLRYEGMDSVNSYKIKVLSFWYQRTWAIILFIITAVLLFIVLPYVLYKRRLRIEMDTRQRNEDRLKNNQSQLKPHFIFNALNSIDSLLHEGQNEKATAYLADFSDMMRNTLRNGDTVFTNLAEDIATLEKYIRIEQLRFDFRYDIRMDPAINAGEVEFPPMLLQPSVENAVKHGVAGMGQKGVILIDISCKGNDLFIAIKDNGPQKNQTETTGTGHGIVFTKERIAFLYTLYKYEITHELQRSPGGMLVSFHFKNWL